MSVQKKTLIAAAVVIWTILFLEVAASIWYLYWIFSWFDILMHFLGGLFIGLIVFVIISRNIAYVKHHTMLAVFVIISGTMFIGVLWEGLEFFLDLLLGTNTFQPNLSDTMLDFALDFVGSLAATGWVLCAMHNDQQKEVLSV